MLQKMAWLLLGALLGLFIGTFLFRQSAQQKEATADVQQQRMHTRIDELQNKLTNLEMHDANATQERDNYQKERDSCQAKFQRSTILYDGVLTVDRGWLIPADVEPISNRPNASYTHFDPKTQTETVRIPAKRQ
ncbi:MAG TPA: hypothetical protein VGR55_01330 [Candidatus Acidoferrum sp.]|nr:hypothetical protein [Candidatus Acidoferrum sp.]